MTYKYAGIIGAALITLTGLTGKPAESQSVPQQNNQQPEVILNPNEANLEQCTISDDPKLTTCSKQTNSPQILPPTETSAPVPEINLSYKLETFNSRVMGGKRSYGVVLPPGYNESPNQQYPVIFLLHGGHGTPKSALHNWRMI